MGSQRVGHDWATITHQTLSPHTSDLGIDQEQLVSLHHLLPEAFHLGLRQVWSSSWLPTPALGKVGRSLLKTNERKRAGGEDLEWKPEVSNASKHFNKRVLMHIFKIGDLLKIMDPYFDRNDPLSWWIGFWEFHYKLGVRHILLSFLYSCEYSLVCVFIRVRCSGCQQKVLIINKGRIKWKDENLPWQRTFLEIWEPCWSF